MKRNIEVNRGERDGLVADAVRTAFVLGVWGWEILAEAAARAFGKGATAQGAAALATSGQARPTSVVGESKTLGEILSDDALAADFEAAFRAMGATEGDRIVGYRFRTPQGVVHPLRLEERQDGDGTLGRAA